MTDQLPANVLLMFRCYLAEWAGECLTAMPMHVYTAHAVEAVAKSPSQMSLAL